MGYKYDPYTGIVYGKKQKPIGKKNIHGYLRSRINGKNDVKLHRFIFEIMGIKIPKDHIVDHIDHDRTNNKWNNLRLVNKLDNARNVSLSCRNKSGKLGVCFSAHHNKWIARIGTKWIGTFDTREEAIKARLISQSIAGYHPNHK